MQTDKEARWIHPRWGPPSKDMPNNIEIEIKVHVENVAKLRNVLEEKGKHLYTSHQIDTYFTPKNHDFRDVRPIKEWLRIRESDKGASINYKNWHYNADGIANHCDEHETNIEDAKSMHLVLASLGCKQITRVDKTRRAYAYGEWEVALDSVKNLGDFVELEYIGDDASANPEQVTQEMIAFLKSVDCGTITRDLYGYPFALLFPDEIKQQVLTEA